MLFFFPTDDDLHLPWKDYVAMCLCPDTRQKIQFLTDDASGAFLHPCNVSDWSFHCCDMALAFCCVC